MKKINNEGLTLIEVMVSIVIISIIFTGFWQSIYIALKSRYISISKNRVSNWAQTIIEYFKTRKLTSLNGKYSPADFQDLNKMRTENSKLENLINRATIVIKEYKSYSNLYQLKVSIYWGRENKEKVYSLSTFLYQNSE